MTNRSTVIGNSTWENRERSYGIDREVFDALLEVQCGSCGICRDPLDTGRSHGTHVDHCHETHVVRGLLCGSCNTKLGRFEALAAWWKEHADRIDHYLDNHAALPIQKPAPRKRGRKPSTPNPEVVAAKAQARREWMRNYKRDQRAAAKGGAA